MRDTMIKEMYIQLAIEDITREMIEELTHRIKESEGSTTLRVNVYDRDAQVSAEYVLQTTQGEPHVESRFVPRGQ